MIDWLYQPAPVGGEASIPTTVFELLQTAALVGFLVALLTGLVETRNAVLRLVASEKRERDRADRLQDTLTTSLPVVVEATSSVREIKVVVEQIGSRLTAVEGVLEARLTGIELALREVEVHLRRPGGVG